MLPPAFGVPGCFAFKTELSRCARDHTAGKASNTYSGAIYRECSPTASLEQCSSNFHMFTDHLGGGVMKNMWNPGPEALHFQVSG